MIGNVEANGSSTLISVNKAPHVSSTRRGPSTPPRYTENGPMNIIAALNDVLSQEALSTPRCNAPRKSARPTLSNRPVQAAIVAPSSTPKTPKVGCVVTSDETAADAVGVVEAEGVLKIEAPPHSHSCQRSFPKHGPLPLWTVPAATCPATDVLDPAQSLPVFAARPWCNSQLRYREAAAQI